MNNRIALRLILYFSSALVLFSVVIGTVFILLFRNQVMRQYEDDLKTRAVSIADTLSDYMSTAESSEMGSGRGMGMGSGLVGYSDIPAFH
jgi:sensor histidine kinase regulating citrate/malate metabolism